MISKDNYGEDHIKQLQLKSRKDPQLIERALYALGLLEALRLTEMEFIFKGGSCLMLLIPQVMRLSTDIDIIVTPGTDVEKYIAKASCLFPFIRYEEQVRIGKNNIEKRHFKFTYLSPIRKQEFYILLDVLFEENHYEELILRKIENKLLLTEGENLSIVVPSINCILGDKLTAFAPHTTGVPLRANKDLEVMKQFYDIGILIKEHTCFLDVQKTYKSIVVSEIAYRGLNISYKDVLNDTIASSIVIASRGSIRSDDYPLYLDGIRGVATHIFSERFSGEIASYRAANIIYMAACLLTETPYESIERYDEYVKDTLEQPDLKLLSKIKKAHPLQYAYLVKADRLLSEYRRTN